MADIIPIHYGLNGKVNAYGGKETIWILPVMGTIIYAGLSVLHRFPHVFNYPIKITKKNAERIYHTSTKMIRALNTLLVYIFTYITYATIQTAYGKQSGLTIFLYLILIISIFGTTYQ